MFKYFVVIILFVFACNKEKISKEQGYANTGQAAAQQEIAITIDVKIIKIENAPNNKFKIQSLVQQDYPDWHIFSVDTLNLYPNFIRREGGVVNMEDPINVKMSRIRDIEKGETISVSIKLKGIGKERHGLIMDWSK